MTSQSKTRGLLLDTSALVWLVSAQERLPQFSREAIRNAAGELWVSAVTAGELAALCKRGKLFLPLPVEKWFQTALQLHGISEMPVSGEISMLAEQLPPIHDDIYDRLIVSTAKVLTLPIVTAYELLGLYPGVRILWEN